MQIQENRKLLLSDTLVADLFILEYLPTLSGTAVKCYLFLLLSARTNRTMTRDELARRLGEEQERIQTALLELAAAELIQLSDQHIQLNDIKAAEIERIYRPKTASMPRETDQAQKRFEQRERLMSDLSRTFFQGMMSPSWYGEIDSWFDRYGFEPEVVYALFQECARRNKLDSKAYISTVAQNWSKRGIVTFQDLNTTFLEYDRIKKLSRKVGRKMRKSMTAYDEELVAKWVDSFGFDFDIIDLALRKTTRMTHPNLSFIDRILEEWHRKQLDTVAAIEAYEAKKAGQYARRPEPAAGRANFEQRSYSSDFFDTLYEPVADETTGSQPQEATPVADGDSVGLKALMEQTRTDQQADQA